MRNNSDKWYMLGRDGKVVEGEGNPEAVSVLAAPGAEVPQDVVDKYDLAARMEGEAPEQVDAAGAPVVLIESGRSIAATALPDGHPAKPRVESRSATAHGRPAAEPSTGSGLSNAPAAGKAAAGHAEAHKPKG